MQSTEFAVAVAQACDCKRDGCGFDSLSKKLNIKYFKCIPLVKR